MWTCGFIKKEDEWDLVGFGYRGEEEVCPSVTYKVGEFTKQCGRKVVSLFSLHRKEEFESIRASEIRICTLAMREQQAWRISGFIMDD